MTEANTKALEAAIRAHEAQVGENTSSSNEVQDRRSANAPEFREVTEKLRRPGAHGRVDGTIQEIRNLLRAKASRWPSCRQLESEGVPDLVLRVAAERWNQTRDIPTWEEVLDDIERWLGDGD